MHITKRVAGTFLADLLTLEMVGPTLADTPTADGARFGTPAPQATYDVRYAIPATVAAPNEAKISEWQDMRYVMFIHWGVYSFYAGWYEGWKQGVGYPEQIRAWGHRQTWDSCIPLQGILREEYLAIAQTSEAPNLDTTAWCQQAKDTNTKMLLIASKHHNGFAMQDMATTDYNFTKRSPSHRGPLLKPSQACKQVGIKFGLYPSSIGWEKQPENLWQNTNMLDEKSYIEYIHAQLKELLGGKCDRIVKLWYDMRKLSPAQSDQLCKWAHEFQSNIMINSCMGNDRAGFEVGQDNGIQSEQTQSPQESAVSIFHKTWGYTNWDNAAPKFKDTGYPDYPNWDHMINVGSTTALRKMPGGAHKKVTEIVGNMSSIVTLGGQFLSNVGSKFDGSYNPRGASALKGIGDWSHAYPDISNNSRPTHLSIESWGKTMVDDSHVYIDTEKWPADGVVTLRGAGANDTFSAKLDGSDAALTYKVEGSDLIITPPTQPGETLSVITATTNSASNYVPTGLTTIGTETATIPTSGLEKFRAPTPKTGEANFMAFITSDDQIASGISVFFDTEGFMDAYAKYKVSVDEWVIKGPAAIELKEGVGLFMIGVSQTARATLEYDNPAYILRGFGEDTTVRSVAVKAEKLSTPAVTVKPPTVEAGRTITVKGTGFAPEPAVTLTLHSEPVEVDTAIADESGIFSAEVMIPANAEAKDHTVAAESTSPAVTISTSLTMTVPVVPSAKLNASPSAQLSATPASTLEQDGRGGLARTDTNVLIVVAGALIAADVSTAFIRCSRLTRT